MFSIIQVNEEKVSNTARFSRLDSDHGYDNNYVMLDPYFDSL